MKPLESNNFETNAILDSIEEGVIGISLDKKVQYLNRAAERLLGYSLEEAREMSCATVVHCAACDNDCLLERTVSTGQDIKDYRTVLRNKAGQVITVSTNTSLVRDEQGKITGGIEIFSDRREVEALSQKLQREYSFDNIVGKNHRMQEVYALLPQVANSSSPVLIDGECGTGKELMAHSIHMNGPRRLSPFTKLHCLELMNSPHVTESSSFGDTEGSLFWGFGRFEGARGGTVFLDEVGELNLALQRRLLELLKKEESRPDEASEEHGVDVRIIAATSQNLKTRVREGRFLQELYDRLSSINIELPPLRERREDIPSLVQHFLKRVNEGVGKSIPRIDNGAIRVLLNYEFPGNIEELEGIIAYAVVLCRGKVLHPSHLPQNLFQAKDDFVSQASQANDPMKVVEKKLFLKILSENSWNYRGAAQKLKLSRSTFWRRLKMLGIERPVRS